MYAMSLPTKLSKKLENNIDMNETINLTVS